MPITTSIKNNLNYLLSFANLRLDTLTARTKEQARLLALEARGHFDRPIFPVPKAFADVRTLELLKCVARYNERFATFANESANEVGYSFANDYYTTPDAEILYTIVREYKPRRIVEIGSGNSTKLFRQAIRDAGITAKLTSIDPEPRVEIAEYSDEVLRQRVETLESLEIFTTLDASDILFIDSSHTVRTGNDVVFLFLNVLPQLRSGVVVHIHDVFLPFDYPREIAFEHHWGWNEQYLVQLLVESTGCVEVIWPGYYLQRNLPDFHQHFPHLKPDQNAQSLWLRKTIWPSN